MTKCQTCKTNKKICSICEINNKSTTGLGELAKRTYSLFIFREINPKKPLKAKRLDNIRVKAKIAKKSRVDDMRNWYERDLTNRKRHNPINAQIYNKQTVKIGKPSNLVWLRFKGKVFSRKITSTEKFTFNETYLSNLLEQFNYPMPKLQKIELIPLNSHRATKTFKHDPYRAIRPY